MRKWCALVVSAVLLGVVGTSVAAAAVPLPANDPFYAPPAGFADAKPGTVLRTRQTSIVLSGLPTPLPATQVLYRTQNQLGEPVATVATVVNSPTAGATPAKLMSYQIAYDCNTGYGRPSFQLNGGSPASQYVTLEAGPALSWLAQGYSVVVSDYEGPTDDYGAGRESGAQTLDGIRAAEQVLKLDAKTPAGMVGSSGGAIATIWAAQLQPSYASELNIFGAAAGGIPVSFANVIDYASGHQGAGALPYVVAALIRAYRAEGEADKYLSDTGKQIVAEASQACLGGKPYTNFKIESLFKPEYQNWKQIPFLARILNDSIMGRGDTPKFPLLMGAGTMDGVGDGIMVTKDHRQLAYEFCQRGGNVEFREYQGLPHVAATETVNTVAAPVFFAQALAGQQQGNCSSITPGNPLTPLPVADDTPAPALIVRVFGLDRRAHGLVVKLAGRGGSFSRVTVSLRRGTRVIAKTPSLRVGTRARRVVLRVRGRAPRAGRYTLVTRVGGKPIATRTITIGKRR